jgi:hypothetical protein
MAVSEKPMARKTRSQLEENVRSAHVSVGLEEHGKPIKHFSCRELPLGKLELFDFVIDPVAIHRRI